MNKTMAVLNYMIMHETITTFEAFQKFGATRLADIIYRLKKHGYEIASTEKEHTDRYGNKIRYVEYRLIKGKEGKNAEGD